LLWRARRKPVRDDSRPWSRRDAVFAVVCAGIYAATDEFHQLFIPSRGASGWDVLLDSLGAAVGIFLLWWVGRRRKLW
jgi:VanZ family protein